MNRQPLRELFQTQHALNSAIFGDAETPGELVQRIPAACADLVGSRRVVRGRIHAAAHIEEGDVYIDDDAVVEACAFVAAGSYIGPGVVVRHGALIRSACVFLDGAVLGHASEAKNSVFYPEAKAPHFSYVGDSVLGARVNLGAGTKLSNVKLSNSNIGYESGGTFIDTGLRKFGSVLGDDCKTGCNSVLNPGVVMGRQSLIGPGVVVRPAEYAACSEIFD